VTVGADGDLDLARRIVARHLAAPGAPVAGIRVGPDGPIVRAGSLDWVVVPANLGGQGFVVFDVRSDDDIDPPPAPEGVAVFDDGESFHLNDPDGFRSFWTRAGVSLEPEVLADLLATYQSGEYRGHVILTGDDLARRVADPVTLPDCVPPVSEASHDRVRVRFCTYTVAPTGPHAEDRVAVHAWEVDGGRDGGPIEWSSERIAELEPDSA
jgi:hypothetical protein